MRNLLILFGGLGLVLLISCGKPNDPESIVPDDISGGYKVVATFHTPGYAQDVIKKDNLLYMAQGEGGLLVVDVSEPAHPAYVSQTTEEVRGYSAKIAMKDSVIYLAAGTFGITAINAAHPDTPFVTVSNLGMKPARNILIMGRFMFTATSEQGVAIAEISYPSQPDIRGGINTMGYAYGLAVTSDTGHLFVACGEMGLSIHNIADFQEGFGTYPLTAWCDLPGYAESVALDEGQNLAFLACGTEGLQIVDYSDTTDLHIVGSYDSGGYAKELVCTGGKVYLTTEKQGLQLVDVSNPASPKLLGQVETDFALGITAEGNYIYVADEVEGLIIVSIPAQDF